MVRVTVMPVHDRHGGWRPNLAECGVALPLAGRVIAKHDLIPMLAQDFAPLPKLVIDRADLIKVAGNESLFRPGLKGG